MHHLSTEHRSLKDRSSLADNIVRHIRKYQIYGKVVIITDNPPKLLPSIKQAWNDLKQEMRREIDHLPPDSNRKSLLMNRLMYMQYCSFTTTPPIDNPREQAMIATPDQVLAWPPMC